MKVSVVIPVYNKAPYLRECLQSILGQTLQDFEVIAVDDRSTDDSLAVLRSFTDPRIRVVEQARNGGPAAAARTAMDLAQGEYIIRVDADDVSLPKRFAEQVRFMDARPELGVSGTRVVDLDRPHEERPVPMGVEACMAEVFFTVPVFQPTAIYRRSVLLQHDLAFDPGWPRIGEDWLFYIAAAKVTRIDNLDRVLVQYRTGPQNISHGQDMHLRWRAALQVGLPMLGLEATDAQMECHLLTKPTFLHTPDAAMVRRFRAWVEHMKGPGRPAFAPAAAFEDRLERSWDRLFHFLCDRNVWAALEHWRIGPRRSWAQLSYLAKSQAARWRGTQPYRA